MEEPAPKIDPARRAVPLTRANQTGLSTYRAPGGEQFANLPAAID